MMYASNIKLCLGVPFLFLFCYRVHTGECCRVSGVGFWWQQSGGGNRTIKARYEKAEQCISWSTNRVLDCSLTP